MQSFAMNPIFFSVVVFNYSHLRSRVVWCFATCIEVGAPATLEKYRTERNREELQTQATSKQERIIDKAGLKKYARSSVWQHSLKKTVTKYSYYKYVCLGA